jgi:predicted enzyme related to lactoylglutathione lyase
MMPFSEPAAGQFCWADLAASDAGCAQTFYAEVFGWTYLETPANGGTYIRARLSGRDIASMYQLGRSRLVAAVSSHWLPYIRVDDADAVARKAVACGGQVLVRPFVVPGVARIALVLDAVGAQVGLWEPTDAEPERGARA